MTLRIAYGTAVLGLSIGLVGCGGKGPSSEDAVVVIEPGASVPAASNIAAPTGGGSTPAANPSPAATSAPAIASTPTKSDGWGTFKGQVVFGGPAPAVQILEEKGKAEKDKEYCAKDASIKSERLVVDEATKGVKNVLVYFPKPTAVNEEAKSARAGTEITFDQTKCIFEPHVLAMMVGSQVTLKSSDQVNHNVNAKLQKNSPFNSTMAAGQTTQYKPDDAERAPIPVNCDIHPWMQAWWLVLDNPYFATTDDKGNFEIKNVPAGTQKVVVWQEATGNVTTAAGGEEVTIKAGDTTSKSWTIDPGKVKPAK